MQPDLLGPHVEHLLCVDPEGTLHIPHYNYPIQNIRHISKIGTYDICKINYVWKGVFWDILLHACKPMLGRQKQEYHGFKNSCDYVIMNMDDKNKRKRCCLTILQKMSDCLNVDLQDLTAHLNYTTGLVVLKKKG